MTAKVHSTRPPMSYIFTGAQDVLEGAALCPKADVEMKMPEIDNFARIWIKRFMKSPRVSKVIKQQKWPSDYQLVAAVASLLAVVVIAHQIPALRCLREYARGPLHFSTAIFAVP